MGKRSRDKGASWERSVARQLQFWLGSEWHVYRIQADRQQGQKGEAGDIGFRGPFVFPFAVEAKHSKSFRAGQLWKGSGPFLAWWAQTSDQAATVGLEPLLVLKGNGADCPALVAMRTPTARRLMGQSCSWGKRRLLCPGDPDLDLTVFRFDDLLAHPCSCLMELL